jgi:hypothetical protein
MADNIVLMPASRGTTLDAETAKAYTELLVQTIWLLDKQIGRAERLLGTDRAHHLLRAIEAHVVDKLHASLQLQSVIGRVLAHVHPVSLGAALGALTMDRDHG